jgi:hypothetical protein
MLPYISDFFASPKLLMLFHQDHLNVYNDNQYVFITLCDKIHYSLHKHNSVLSDGQLVTVEKGYCH